ncbi:SDR family NAD(P)-dependent oxidoreductase [Salinibacterium soli]|uniref:SDR family oxidoreductase n=1 Tax=Antiquaquibacter soli TaxID=3064523 RepID=A0ABT9BJ86_9MICO|nr:SDR family oxidoreductase [Protaetiibacter sp. WY-16]MDO7880614.1 SDR family oxidoreductase [Protaetiibacter sp. WY-16]
MTRPLEGKWALVTGSAHNLGLAIATELAEQGARVLVHGLHGAEEAAARVAAAVPGSAPQSLAFDLADPDAVAEAFAELEVRGIRLDILVNNAAHLGITDVAALDQSGDLFRDVLEVNVFGTYQCSILAARAMAAHGGGSIVNISSLAGQRAIHDRLAYNTSKAAIDGMTRSMAIDFAEYGVRVNAIAPGYVWSDRWEAIGDEEAVRRRARIPAGAETTQREIASLVAYLASGSAPTLTGEVIAIDGGLAAQQSPRAS